MRRVNVTFSEQEYNHIEKASKINGVSTSEYVRNLYFKGKEIYSLNDNKDELSEFIEATLERVIKPHIERLASISAKGAIMSSASTFLNAQALAEFVPAERRRDFLDVYNKCRLEGIAYVKSKTNDESEIKKSIEKSIVNNE